MKVAVIIPAFNYARYLPMAIESVLRQTHRDFDLLVVDDGSTDPTPEIVASFVQRDSRVRYLRQTNAGLSAARNTGIAHTAAPLLAFLDADDEWDPGFLQSCAQKLAQLPPSFGLVACVNVWTDARGSLQPGWSFGTNDDQEISRDDLLIKSRFFPSAVVVHRKVFERCGFFDTGLHSSEDRDMWIRCARLFRILLVGEPMVRIRRHDANMSRNSDRMRENMRRVLRKAWREDGGCRHRWPFWLQVASIFYMQNSWMRYAEGRRLGAVMDLVRSMILWPVFLRPASLGEPELFRCRRLARFVLRPAPSSKNTA